MDVRARGLKADVLVAILHFGDEEVTHQCLDSLRGAGTADVVIIDDDPREVFDARPGLGFSVRIIRTGGGMGFAEAYNFGLKQARNSHHRYLYLANNDIIFTQQSIDTLKETFADSRVGLAGPAVFYTGARRLLWACGGRVFRWTVSIDGIRKMPVSKQTIVDYVPAAALMTPVDVWDAVGGFSEKYCFCFEEAEFALEVQRNGYQVVANANSEVLHEVGDSSNREPMFYYNTVRNRVRFARYLHGPKIGWILGWLSGFLRSYSVRRQRIFAVAIRDEINNVPLTRATLAEIREKFSLLDPHHYQ